MSIFVHGDNILQKENHKTKYRDAKSRQYLTEIRSKYEEWKQENLSLTGPLIEPSPDDKTIIERRVELFNQYKDFIDQQNMLNNLIHALIYIPLLLKNSCIIYLKTWFPIILMMH